MDRIESRYRRGVPLIGRVLAVALAIGSAPQVSFGWDEAGHTIITLLALQTLPKEIPDWLRTPEIRTRLCYLSSEPDRWRGHKSDVLDHVNEPDHYVDEELLHPYGLSLKNLPPLRREFTDILAVRRALHPGAFEAYDRVQDPKYVRSVPGLLPYSMAEGFWKLTASWTTLKTYEKHRDCVTDEMMDNARQNIVYVMGTLSHFVGDGAQPLHITKHFNGWAGDNPNGYTTDRSIHRFIDRGVFDHHGITPEPLITGARPARAVKENTYWEVIRGYLYESFEQVEPLYQLEKSGELRELKGRQFIEERLREGGAMLSGLWVAAFECAKIDEYTADQLQKRRDAR